MGTGTGLECTNARFGADVSVIASELPQDGNRGLQDDIIILLKAGYPVSLPVCQTLIGEEKNYQKGPVDHLTPC